MPRICGLWFLRGPIHARKPIYRGVRQDLRLSIAIAYSGHMMIELIQQHDDQPSVYRESFEKNGYGFHHWGIASDRYDDDFASYLKRGFEPIFTDETPVATRVAYFDAKRGWPGFIELIESILPRRPAIRRCTPRRCYGMARTPSERFERWIRLFTWPTGLRVSTASLATQLSR